MSPLFSLSVAVGIDVKKVENTLARLNLNISKLR
jgi:hypothetical protein